MSAPASLYLQTTVGRATGNKRFNPFGTLVNYVNRLGHPTPPAFDPIFSRIFLVHQAIDLASEKNAGESRRQGEKNKRACVLDIGNLARQPSNQNICAGFAS